MDEYWEWKEQEQHCEIGEVAPVTTGV